MYVNTERRMVYLAHPGTASNSTARALATVGFVKVAGGDHHSKLYDLEQIRVGPNGYRVFKPGEDTRPGLDVPVSPVTRENREDWFVFTTVRNHWDTAISWAFRKYGQVEPVWNVQTLCAVLGEHYPPSKPRRFTKINPWIGNYTLWHRHSNDADFCMRYDRLQHDLRYVLGHENAPDLPEKWWMESAARQRRLYRQFYTEPMKEYIANRFKAEIDRFGFSF